MSEPLTNFQLKNLMEPPRATRKLNLIAGGQHHRPFITIQNKRLPVSRTVKPEGMLSYTFAYDDFAPTTCPCTSVG